MSTFYGPQVNAAPLSSSGLILLLDAANPKSVTSSQISPWRSPTAPNYVATVSGAPTYTTEGGGGISFNGTTQYYDLNTTSLISGTQAFTIEAWYRIAVMNNGGNILGNYGAGYLTNTLWFSGIYGLYIQGNCYFAAPNAFPLPAGTYSATATRNASGLCSLYLNGVLNNTANLPASIPISALWRIGNDTNSGGGAGGEAMNGVIYNLKVYNREFTAAEVLYNFQAQRARYGL